MQAGQLRTPVSIQEPTKTRDDAGQVTYSYSTVRTTWAAVQTSVSGQQDDEDGIVEADRFQIRMRWMPDITLSSEWRLLYGAKTWQIVGTENVRDRDRELLVEVEEVG
jgi:head-tail adaptor